MSLHVFFSIPRFVMGLLFVFLVQFPIVTCLYVSQRLFVCFCFHRSNGRLQILTRAVDRSAFWPLPRFILLHSKDDSALVPLALGGTSSSLDACYSPPFSIFLRSFYLFSSQFDRNHSVLTKSLDPLSTLCGHFFQ